MISTLIIKNGLRSYVPKAFKDLYKRMYNPLNYHQPLWNDKYNQIINAVKKRPLLCDRKVYIVKDVMLRHAYYEAACLELGVEYKVIDIYDEQIDFNFDSTVDVMFIRPYVLTTYGKRSYDDFTHIISKSCDIKVFPSEMDLWIYESKVRCTLLMRKLLIPHPDTFIFYEKEKAVRYVKSATYPIVFKTDLGSDSSGVVIIKHLSQAIKLINKCFNHGYSSTFFDPNDKQQGFILFQKFIKNVKEWRVVRIGNSYFAYEKGKKGEFHSGTKIKYFADPPMPLMEFVRAVTDKLGTRCMSVDIFCDEHEYYVSELQTYFGVSEYGGEYYYNGTTFPYDPKNKPMLMVGGKIGRYFYMDGKWEFNEGNYTDNALTNLRVMLAFQDIGKPISDLIV